MNKEEVNLRTWCTKFINGDYARPEAQKEAGWRSYFCHQSSLPNKTYAIGKILTKIRDGGKVDRDLATIELNNRMSCFGPGRILVDVIHIKSYGFKDYEIELHTATRDPERRYIVNGYNVFDSWDQLYETDSVKELISWFNDPGKPRQKLDLKGVDPCHLLNDALKSKLWK